VELSLKRKVAIGATAAVVLGGGGAAYAVTKANDGGRQAFLGDVAKRLNVTPQQLNNAIKGATEDRIQAAVKAGKLTQAQADQIKKKIEAAPAGVPFVGPGLVMGGPRFGFRFGGPGGPISDGISAASKYLGLTDQQLMDKLSSGKSLADVAGEQNKSVDGLKSAITDSVKSNLDSAVKAGKLTQAQENKLLSDLTNRLDTLVNRKGLGPGPGFGIGGQVMRAGPGLLLKSGLDSAAKYLGLSDQQLVQKLASGKSLADVAGEQNKSVDGLKSAITGSVKSNLDSAVKAGKITQTQENNILGRLNNRLDKLVNGKGFVGPPAGMLKRRAFGAERGFHFGGAPAGGPPPGFPII
jgi:urease accessory protein UreF